MDKHEKLCARGRKNIKKFETCTRSTENMFSFQVHLGTNNYITRAPCDERAYLRGLGRTYYYYASQ